MRRGVVIAALLGLAGCRSLLGFEQARPIDDAPPRDTTIDSLVIDSSVDVPLDTPAACSTFSTITGGQAGHMYKLVATPGDWQALQMGCVTDGGYLAIPNDAAELTAIATLASSITWIGITDQVSEGTVVDVFGVPYMALPLGTNSGARDCGVAKDVNPPVEIENCGNNHLGVCECDP